MLCVHHASTQRCHFASNTVNLECWQVYPTDAPEQMPGMHKKLELVCLSVRTTVLVQHPLCTLLMGKGVLVLHARTDVSQPTGTHLVPAQRKSV